jgi:predicted nucleotidyltransferase
MPVRSLSSPVLKWPEAAIVDNAVRMWARETAAGRPEVARIGYFGSYARGDWGAGSDLDLVIIVDQCAEPFERRAVDWDATDLPVPADVLVYTEQEWERLSGGSFVKRIREEAVWVYTK